MTKVLVVDDDSHIRDVVSFALEQAGYQVQQASDGRAAVVAAQRNQLDLIVLDIMMPEMDGYETLKRVRDNKDLSHTKVVFLSAKSKEKDVEKGLKMGADSYMTKPFSIKKVISDIEDLLG